MDPKVKLLRKLKNRFKAVEAMKAAAQKMHWAVVTNPKVYSDEATLGYIIGEPDYVVYVRSLIEADLEKQAQEEAAAKDAQTQEMQGEKNETNP